MFERWKPAYGFEEYYSVSNLGNVKRVKKATGTKPGKPLKPWIHEGRAYVSLSVKCTITKTLVSRLVCLTWKGPPPTPQHQAAHWDGNALNNVETNLRWATQAENEQDKKRHGRWNHAPKGSKHRDAKLKESDIEEIRCLRNAKISYAKIAERYGVTWSTIRGIIKGRTWNHV